MNLPFKDSRDAIGGKGLNAVRCAGFVNVNGIKRERGGDYVATKRSPPDKFDGGAMAAGLIRRRERGRGEIMAAAGKCVSF